MSEPDDMPAAAYLAELEALRSLADKSERAIRAWEVLMKAAAFPDFPVVLDFALEHEFVRAATPDDPATLNPTWINPIDGSEMVWVPPGRFYVGRDLEVVSSERFSLARFPVTNSQFRYFVEQTGYVPPATHPDNDRFLAHWSGGRVPPEKDEHPVVWVSYIDAQCYCRWAGLTLPTEWLWEKAARGADGRPYPWGGESPGAARRRFAGRSLPQGVAHVAAQDTCAVGSFPRTRTPYGCEDMIGNVSEWCQPAVSADRGALPDPLPSLPPMDVPAQMPVRGACFLRVDPLRMPGWHRRRLSIFRRNRWVGFRPASTLPCRPAE